MRYGYLPCVPWLSEGTPFLQSLPKASNQGRTGLKVQECKAGTGNTEQQPQSYELQMP